MLIDFNSITPVTMPGMKGGTGEMTCRMYNDGTYRIIPTAIHPGGSVGLHTQGSGDDLNFIISGFGKTVCDGVAEELKPGVMHVCHKGSEHRIENNGTEDLIMLTVVVTR